ncbi:MAG: Hsp33 family molecular chaperone HslO [Kiritimatiellaeota bacterium]|nr:Hsp33 family molecular chaperone HslO [Kiritimatiellota bacterium]
MIMSKVADCRMAAFSPSAKIRVVQVEVTDSARELERSHLCGPTAGLIQAEALAGVALLGADLAEADETVTLRMKASGPLAGLLVEAAADGGLRGYTQVKVLNDLDAAEELDTSAALGDFAEVQVIRSRPGKVINSALFEMSPASVSRGLEMFFKQSLQRPVWVQTSALAYGAFIDSARGLMAELLPDGNADVFADLEASFSDNTVLDCLEASTSIKTICETLGLADCTFEAARPLRFACRCSVGRVEGMLATLPTKDIRAMLAKTEPVQVFCHMCGKGYRVASPCLEQILRDRE